MGRRCCPEKNGERKQYFTNMLYSLNREKQPMRDAEQSEHELQGDLMSILRDLPNVTSVYEETLESPDYGIDFVVNASVNGKPVRLLVQTKSALFPRDVRAAFWNLKSASTRPLPGAANVPTIPMIAAGSISDGAKELLQTERIGYLDGAGSLFLRNEDFYILIDKPSAKRARKIDRPLFSGNRSAVVHALLVNPQQWFSTTELAKLVSISPSTVSVVFAELEKRDLVTAHGKGPNKTRRLADPTALLDEWVKQTQLQPRLSAKTPYQSALPLAFLRIVDGDATFINRLELEGYDKAAASIRNSIFQVCSWRRISRRSIQWITTAHELLCPRPCCLAIAQQNV
jgi:hypothetical protein